MRLLSDFGKLTRSKANLVMIVLSGFAEGAGLALFVPLLDALTDGKADRTSSLVSTLKATFEAIGLTLDVPTLLLAIATLILGSLGLAYAQKTSIIRSQQEFTRDTRDRVVRRLFATEWPYLSQIAHGAVVNAVVVESHRAGAALMLQIFIIASILQIVVLLGLSFFLSWQLILVTAGFVLLCAPVVLPFHRRAKKFGAAIKQSNLDVNFHTVDYLRGTKLVKVTASEQAVGSQLFRHFQSLFTANFGAEVNLARVYFLVQAIPVILLTAMIAIANLVLKIDPTITLVFLLMMARVAPRIAQLQQYYQSYLINLPALAAVEDFLASAEARRERQTDGGKPIGRLRRGIQIENVGYLFPDADLPALQGVSIAIEKGKIVALVGSSGAGKSTLVDILCGLRKPTSGRVLVDGRDLTGIDLQSWRRRIGYVTQEITVFNTTLRDNLAFAAPEANESQLRRALELAHLGPVVDRLPDGLETVLGEGGVRLSGGERQRIGLARALVGVPDVLILDEASSALDAESERAVQDALETIAPDLATVIVAHRLSTIRNADRIYVLEAGRVVEEGTYDELLALSGRFAELHGMSRT